MPAVAQKPDLTNDAIRQWLAEHYALDGSLEPLPGESELNLKLRTAAGDSFVCKISSSADDLDHLAAQHEVLALLNERDLAAIAHVLSSKQGDSLVPLSADGKAYVGRVLSFVPGQILAKCAPYSQPLLRDLGHTVGRLTRALAGYDHAAFHCTFDWDLAHALPVVQRYRDLITDRPVRDAVVQIERDFENIVVPRLNQLNKSVIHSDANDYNILAQGDKITGLIDFGDMVYSYTICDLAIAMAYATLGADDALPAIKAMAIGYSDAMPILEDELAVLFPMMRMRLAVSACMSAHQSRLRPDDPYLAISQEPIRKTLPKLLALDVDDVHHLLKEALA